MRSRSLRAAVLGCAILTAFALGASAREQPFVEFRARSGPDLVGHSFIVFGTLDDRGRIARSEVAGLYTPEEFYWKGIVIPLPGVVGAEKEDVTVRSMVVYRHYLTWHQFQELKAGVSRVRAAQHTWHFLFFNCNDFVGEMAESIGLRRPPSLMLPVSYVALLRAMNGPSSYR